MKARIILSILIIILTTCKKDHLLDCLKSAGKTITEDRETGTFLNINLTDNVDLKINPGTNHYIKVTAGKNIIDGIITEISGNTLYIRNENRCNWMRSFKNTYTVEVGMDQPVNIYYDGSGDISCLDTIRSNDFVFDCFGGSGSINFIFNSDRMQLKNHIGRSDMHASGTVRECNVFINDVGKADVSSLISQVCHVRNSSTGDCRVKVTSDLSVEILYSGNIYYSGNPVSVLQTVTGSGKLIHL